MFEADDLEMILETLLNDGEEAFEELEGVSVQSFGEAGLLTRESGLVIRLEDGSEFQLTIVKSK